MKAATKTKRAARKRVPAKPSPGKKAKSSVKKAPPPKPPRKKEKPPPPGLEFREFETLRKQLDLSLDELSARLGLSRSTIEERKATGRLTNDETGKVVCYARLLGHAIHLFGGLNEARQWLKTPQRGLHGAVPLDYARTDIGAREVENLLAQMEQNRS